MSKHHVAANVGEAKIGVGENVEIGSLDGLDNLFLELLGYIGVPLVFGEARGVLPVGFGDLCQHQWIG